MSKYRKPMKQGKDSKVFAKTAISKNTLTLKPMRGGYRR
jgi:hypothetical protein